VADHRVQRRADLHGLVELGQHHPVALRSAVGHHHILDRLALRSRVEDEQLADRRMREHLHEFTTARIALRDAGGVDEHQPLAGQQLQQILQRGAVLCDVNRHAQDAAVGAQLLVRPHPIGIQRDEAQVGSTVLRGKGGGELGGAGGLAHASGAHQREHAALVLERLAGLAGDEVALQHAAGPCSGLDVVGQLVDELAH
jgi:hypothetical protein